MSERTPLLQSDNTASDVVVANAAASDVDTTETTSVGNDSKVSLLRGLTIIGTIFVLILLNTFAISVITTVQSSIAADLHVTDGASWFISVYLIAATSATPIAGKLCEIFSSRLYLLVSSFIQIVGLLVAAFAPSFTTFLFGRVLCGIGAAAITPVAFILVTHLAEQKRWGFFFGLLNCAYTTGIALGAVIGGALEPRIGWRAVFWTQVPICLIAAVVAFFAIPPPAKDKAHGEHTELAVMQKVARIDYFGVLTLMAAIVMLLFWLSSPSSQITPLLLSAAMLALFCLVETRWAVEPVVPPALLRSRAMFFTGISTIGYMCARWAVIFYIPTIGIAVRGWTGSQSGLLLIATNLGFGLGSVIVGFVHIKRSKSFYFSTLVCYGLFTLEQFGLSFLTTPTSPVWLLLLALFMNGFLGGAVLTYNLAHLLYLIKPSHHVIVIPVNAMFRSLSGSIASSLAGGVFTRHLMESLCKGFESKGLYGRGMLIMELLSRPMLVQELQGLEREVAVTSYAKSGRYLFAIGCLWVVPMMILQAGTGWTAQDEKPKNDQESQREIVRGDEPSSS